MKIVIIDYGAGNTKSIEFALKRMGYNALLTSNADLIVAADAVIFPGVGEASSAMKKLKEHGLEKLIPMLTQPVLGICLGMQLMCDFSEEGNTEGLGIFRTRVQKFPDTLKVPQIGWNNIYELTSPLFKGVKENEFMYLVHSYFVPVQEETIAKTNYGMPYATALNKNNFYGVQFHPEKSSKAGAKILANFIEIASQTTINESKSKTTQSCE